MWPVILDNYLDVENEYTENCTATMLLVDFNHDSYVNFKEMAFSGGLLVEPLSNWWLSANCSTCVGMENYNPSHDDL